MSKKRKIKKDSSVSLSKYVGSSKGIGVFLFSLSGIINVLALTGAFYMLQIYDRALTSGSVPTLVALSVLAIGLYLFQGIFDVLRSQLLVRIGARLDTKLAPVAHKVALEMPRYGYSTSEALERGRDVDTLRSFVSSPGLIALFDLPWMPLFLAFVYLLHPMLGMLALGGATVLIMLAILTELLTRRFGMDMQKATIERNNLADSNARNAEIIKAMGFSGRSVMRYQDVNMRHMQLQTKTSDISGTLGGISKVLRMILQSALLGLGAFLTIKGDLSAGAIIACSVASARALAPVDMAIGNWKTVALARRSHRRLKDTLASLDDEDRLLELETPTQSLRLEGVTIVAPGTGSVLLSDVSFDLKAGDGLGLIGPSGGGKTSLAKGIVGIWPLLRGKVRLDGASLDQWRDDELGQNIGYLPQDVSLIDGTIAENISRFDPAADAGKIISAAKIAGVHELIVGLADGYETMLGPDGTALSAGQRQRIGLARALFGNPFLVVLDEPNSNLDNEGETALTAALRKVRARGGIVIVIAHRPSALAALDLVGIVQAGRLTAIGPKDEILNGKKEQPQRPQQPAAKVGAGRPLGVVAAHVK